MLRALTGWVAFSLADKANGHGPDQMVSQNHRGHFDSANNAEDLIQPWA